MKWLSLTLDVLMLIAFVLCAYLWWKTLEQQQLNLDLAYRQMDLGERAMAVVDPPVPEKIQRAIRRRKQDSDE